MDKQLKKFVVIGASIGLVIGIFEIIWVLMGFNLNLIMGVPFLLSSFIISIFGCNTMGCVPYGLLIGGIIFIIVGILFGIAYYLIRKHLIKK